jgi:biofilm PGA synthesis N-glycosyltransferase PgaC
MLKNAYILLSSVKDEGDHLEAVLTSVLNQSIPPRRWYITNDGSTDRSTDILRDFAAANPIIRLTENPPREGRNWASKDRIVNASYKRAVSEIAFDFVGQQDGDQAPAKKDFFERLLAEANKNEAIGLLGGVVYERKAEPKYSSRPGEWLPRPCNASDSTPGSALFRRECFEATGGYLPLEYGGSDWLIQVDAQRAGYTVKVVPECRLLHYRQTNQSTVKGAFKAGLMDASLGSDFLFELVKCARRLGHAPLGLPGSLRLAGYLYYRATRPPLIEADRSAFLRTLQRSKISGKFARKTA